MSEEQAKSPTLVEKWIQDQQEWQKMAMEYFDSMVNNDEFLTHLGNAMRGSLLAGKPYPGTEPAEAADAAPATDDRIDEILHTLHVLQGEIADLKMIVADLEHRAPASIADTATSSTSLNNDPAASAASPAPAGSNAPDSPDIPAGSVDRRG